MGAPGNHRTQRTLAAAKRSGAPTDASFCAPDVRDLALISDRRTGAIVAHDGTIVWYCPGRFDRASLLGGLLDRRGGFWRIERPDVKPVSRRYLGVSGVLETTLATAAGELTVTDWMALGHGAPHGALCRLFSPAPVETRVALTPRTDYARKEPRLRRLDGGVEVDGSCHLYASHRVGIDGGKAFFTVPEGQPAWAVLAEDALADPARARVDEWLESTLQHWEALSCHASYNGPYERAVVDSLRAIRLLTHEETGGVIAAATTSLPEIVGGAANWDYRFVWLRDAGMIVSALTRLGGDLSEGSRYLDFICASRGSARDYPLAVFTTLDGDAAADEEILPMRGYRDSRPVRIGNGAGTQMQRDAFANVLLAAKLIYQRCDERPHWETVSEIAEFLVEHWHEPDHGIWEEPVRRQYTASKVIVACALDSVAEFCTDEKQAKRWRDAVQKIRTYVAERCLTRDGAYAVFAGSDDVDVSAALFPIWAYTDPDTPEMLATIKVLEEAWSQDGLLYWRRLECSDSRKEGAFLAATFWVAQYWIMRGETYRARHILDEALEYANDVGLFAEEADPSTGAMLGNIPQAFVHAAFIGAVVDLKAAMGDSDQAQKQQED